MTSGVAKGIYCQIQSTHAPSNRHRDGGVRNRENFKHAIGFYFRELALDPR